MDYASNTGIYKIENILDGKIYIGSSKNLKQRLNSHKRELKNNKHVNKRLQNAYNKYGDNNFYYEIVEFVEESSLLEREQHHIDVNKSYDRNLGYNINHCARGGFAKGEENFWYGKGYLREGFLNNNFGNTGEKNPLSKPILQVDINTMEVIKRFPATIEIRRTLGFHSGNICDVCSFLRNNKVRKKYKDFYWCYEEDLDILLKSKPFVSSQVKSVVKLDIETKELLEVFPTVSLAAQSVNMGRESISRACKGKIKYSAGYKWMYLEEYEKIKSAN